MPVEMARGKRTDDVVDWVFDEKIFVLPHLSQESLPVTGNPVEDILIAAHGNSCGKHHVTAQTHVQVPTQAIVVSAVRSCPDRMYVPISQRCVIS